ncbi:hypothetical protein EJB05_35796 [Eragrostis curvula]|uniref:Uncharacterized protein n=1 Tax=Eragrostis curvula TaxID=38414 RepID=A0A5J9U7P3_9POAL|nr:hypothetical protein EJB05_35796 [Eragrostis curvula]
MAPRNAALKALLVATLVSSLLFQGALGSAFHYCDTYRRCLNGSRIHPPGGPDDCFKICMRNRASHEMGVTVAAGVGNLGKGDDGTETGAAP